MTTDLTFDECERILLAAHYGHLGCVHDGHPYVIPVTYVYKNTYLYSHTREGKKIDIMRKNPDICIQVEQVRAGNDWDSVICWGDFEEVTDHEEIREIHAMLADQYARIQEKTRLKPVSPLIENLSQIPDASAPKDVVYRLNIRKTTGKAQRPGR